MQTSEAKKKQGIALLTIGLSAVALILGFLMRTPIKDSFSLGGWIGFIAFLLSLGTLAVTHQPCSARGSVAAAEVQRRGIQEAAAFRYIVQYDSF